MNVLPKQKVQHYGEEVIADVTILHDAGFVKGVGTVVLDGLNLVVAYDTFSSRWDVMFGTLECLQKSIERFLKEQRCSVESLSKLSPCGTSLASS